MTAVDANGSGWLVLRTPADFLARRLPTGGVDVTGPQLGAGIAYDPARRALELLPREPADRNRLLPSRAVDVDGSTYLVAGSAVLVERCDRSRAVLMADPALAVDPAGMAIDRRGLLYVADRRARQVLVVSLADGRLEARLSDPSLREPVDVAVAPDGTVVVADRGGGDLLGIDPGQIVLFGPDHELVGRWTPRNAAVPPRPRRPRPIALLWHRGQIVVADAYHPRLLAFDRSGQPAGEHEVARLAADLLDELGVPAHEAVGPLRHDLARLVGLCGCPPELDIGVALARSHRALRLQQLDLHRRFRSCGTWQSAVLDSGVAGTRWHRLELDADLPAGTRVRVDTATAEDPSDLADVRDGQHGPGCGPRRPTDRPGQVTWDPLVGRGDEPVAFTGSAPPEPSGRFEYDLAATAATLREQLVQSGPGRYLRVRLVLGGTGSETPSVRGVRVVLPRRTYRRELPGVFGDDPDASRFLDGFLSLFERSLSRIEDRRDDFYRRLGPAAAPPEVLDWLAALLDLSFDPSWPLGRRRALVTEAVELYRRRGTPAGIARYVEIYTGIRPVITEAFLERPGAPPVTGTRAVLGATTALAPRTQAPPDEALARDYAHRFTVHLPVPDRCEREVVVPVVDRIVEVAKPAHTEHRLNVVGEDARAGIETTVGLDLVVGARRTPRTRLGEGPERPVLGRDTVLGPRTPHPRPPDQIL